MVLHSYRMVKGENGKGVRVGKVLSYSDPNVLGVPEPVDQMPTSHAIEVQVFDPFGAPMLAFVGCDEEGTPIEASEESRQA